MFYRSTSYMCLFAKSQVFKIQSGLERGLWPETCYDFLLCEIEIGSSGQENAKNSVENLFKNVSSERASVILS